MNTEDKFQLEIAKANGWKLVESAPFELWVNDKCFCHNGDTCKGHDTYELLEILELEKQPL